MQDPIDATPPDNHLLKFERRKEGKRRRGPRRWGFPALGNPVCGTLFFRNVDGGLACLNRPHGTFANNIFHLRKDKRKNETGNSKKTKMVFINTTQLEKKLCPCHQTTTMRIIILTQQYCYVCVLVSMYCSLGDGALRLLFRGVTARSRRRCPSALGVLDESLQPGLEA